MTEICINCGNEDWKHDEELKCKKFKPKKDCPYPYCEGECPTCKPKGCEKDNQHKSAHYPIKDINLTKEKLRKMGYKIGEFQKPKKGCGRFFYSKRFDMTMECGDIVNKKILLCPECKPKGCGKEACGVETYAEDFGEDFDITMCGDYCPYHKTIHLCPECNNSPRKIETKPAFLEGKEVEDKPSVKHVVQASAEGTFNLSEKIIDEVPNYFEESGFIFKKDVKTFIQKLKEDVLNAKSDYDYHTNCCFESHEKAIKEAIDKLAGEDLK